MASDEISPLAATGFPPKLIRPKPMSLRRGVFGATMPEAAVYKDGDHRAGDY